MAYPAWPPHRGKLRPEDGSWPEHPILVMSTMMDRFRFLQMLFGYAMTMLMLFTLVHVLLLPHVSLLGGDIDCIPVSGRGPRPGTPPEGMSPATDADAPDRGHPAKGVVHLPHRVNAAWMMTVTAC